MHDIRIREARDMGAKSVIITTKYIPAWHSNLSWDRRNTFFIISNFLEISLREHHDDLLMNEYECYCGLILVSATEN